MIGMQVIKAPPMAFKIVTKKGGVVPRILKGLWTSEALAQKAIGTYNESVKNKIPKPKPKKKGRPKNALPHKESEEANQPS